MVDWFKLLMLEGLLWWSYCSMHVLSGEGRRLGFQISYFKDFKIDESHLLKAFSRWQLDHIE